jgi:transmembrane sensor
VQTGNAVARVLGTTFMVRQYATDQVARIVVADGRVSLQGVRGGAIVGKSTVLASSTLGTVDDSGNVQVTPQIAVEDYTSWTTGRLVFRDTPACDVVAELGRAYGVDIRIADSALAAHVLSWKVALAQRSLADVLQPLVDILDAHSVRAGGGIIIVPGRAASVRPADPNFLYKLESRHGK